MKCTVYTCTESPAEPGGLSPTDVVYHIYRHEGRKYWLEPKMEVVLSGDGEETGEQQAQFLGKLEWVVWFQDPKGRPYKGAYPAYGGDEDEALALYLQGCWDKTRWDDTKWVIEADEDFLEGQKAIEENQLQRG